MKPKYDKELEKKLIQLFEGLNYGDGTTTPTYFEELSDYEPLNHLNMKISNWYSLDMQLPLDGEAVLWYNKHSKQEMGETFYMRNLDSFKEKYSYWRYTNRN